MEPRADATAPCTRPPGGDGGGRWEPRLSVLLCSYNGEGRLPVTLGRILGQDDPCVPWEMVFVDNGSTDGTVALVRDMWPGGFRAPLRVVLEPRKGLAEARMTGIRACRGDVIVFVDDDNHLDPGYLGEAVRIMDSRPRLGMCRGASVLAGGIVPPSWFSRHERTFAVGNAGEAPVDLSGMPQHLWGAGAVLRREAVESLFRRGWTPLVTGATPGGEDTELAYALLLSGWDLWYFPALRFTHSLSPDRLTWDRLRATVRTYARRSVEIDPYVAAGEGSVDPRRWRWLRQVRKALREMVRPRRLLAYGRSRLAGVEGVDEVIWMEWGIGRLAGLWANRFGYGERMEKVRNGPWRTGS